MRVQITHSRDIPAGPEELGRLVAALGGEHDRLWPNEQWPGTPIRFDRPLGPGARGGHGVIRYSVEAYERDRRVVFRFEPGSGLDGTHGLEIEPLADGRTRLSHTLDTRLEGAVRLAKPLLARMHDTIVGQLLDNAELATAGPVARPTRMPLWMRAANAVEARIAQAARGERPPAVLTRPARGWRRVAGVAVPGTLLAIAGLHAAWALGWRWPGGSDEAFAERIVSSGELPPAWATWLVAGLLATAAGIVRATARGAAQPLLRAGTWALAAVLMTRGVAFPVYDTVNGFDTVYTRLDAAIYSPLSLALGLGAASVALQRSATPVAAASGARA